MSSRIMTVLPTPAPPNTPTLPPFEKGAIRSTTFMPVSNISARMDWSSKAGGMVNGPGLGSLGRPFEINGLAQNVKNAAQGSFADRYGNRLGGIDHLGPSFQTIGAAHRYRAHPVVTQMLLDFGHQGFFLPTYTDLNGLINTGQMIRWKFHIYYRS